MSEIKSNKLRPRKGGTQTIGDSGDSVTLSSGTITTNAGTISTAGITGGTINNTTGTIEGLQGQINWQTSDIKTEDFTATANEGYFVNTTSGTITATLPASPSAGDLVGFKDYALTFDTNNFTIDPGSNKIQGLVNLVDVTTEGQGLNFIYVDSTRGWILIDAAKSDDISGAPLFTVATGGTITTCGDYKIHTFTGSGTFEVTQLGNGPTNPAGGPQTVSYMVVAGGGGRNTANEGGGSGAGGYREGKDIAPSYTASPKAASSGLTISLQSYPVTVGAGGNSAPGSDSTFDTITSAGGGMGAVGGTAPSGGSGGGAGGTGGSGNTPPVSPPQGNPGGGGIVRGSNNAGGGGGGGASGSGSSATPSPGNAGNGGAGTPTSITGSAVSYAGGGGGAVNNPVNSFSGGSGGSGGGGVGVRDDFPGNRIRNATSGTANTGGGGGAGPGASGGSGIVVIRYKYQ